MEYINNCPVCNTAKFTNVLEPRDYFLTKENFTIVKCEDCGFLFTNPRPLPQNLSGYYKSKDYISHSNTSTGLFAWLYQRIRQYTLTQKFDTIEKFHPAGSLLDIGCGTGEFLHTGKKRGWSVQGIEPNPDAREMAVKNYGLSVFDEPGLTSLDSDQFDVITLWHVLEHVFSLEESILNLKRLLKNDGLLVIAVPNAASKDASIYGKYWAAYDVPRHLYHFTPLTLTKLLNRYSIEVIASRPMIFDAFYISLLSEEYIRGKKNFFKASINGIRSNAWARSHQQNYSSFILLCKKEKT